MATLKSMPAASIIKSFKGSIDFYDQRGVTVARSWPKKGVPGPGTASWCTAKVFQYAVAQTKAANDTTRYLYAQEAVGQPQTYNDIAVSQIFGHTTKNLVTRPNGDRVPIYNRPPKIPYCAIPLPDPQGQLWHPGPMYMRGYATGGRVRFIPDVVGRWRVIRSEQPPIYHQTYKRVRGVDVPCGYEISWWYPIKTVSDCFHVSGGYEFWVNDDQLAGNAFRWAQVYLEAAPGGPTPISLGPIICTWTAKTIFFDVPNNRPVLMPTNGLLDVRDRLHLDSADRPITSAPQDIWPGG